MFYFFIWWRDFSGWSFFNFSRIFISFTDYFAFSKGSLSIFFITFLPCCFFRTFFSFSKRPWSIFWESLWLLWLLLYLTFFDSVSFLSEAALFLIYLWIISLFILMFFLKFSNVLSSECLDYIFFNALSSYV